MPDDPIYRFVVSFLCIPAGAFIAGILLYQFRFRALWCVVLSETYILLTSLLSDNFRVSFDVGHLFLPVLLAPGFAGYYLNKYFLRFPEGR
jgi:hypothetical protein